MSTPRPSSTFRVISPAWLDVTPASSDRAHYQPIVPSPSRVGEKRKKNSSTGDQSVYIRKKKTESSPAPPQITATRDRFKCSLECLLSAEDSSDKEPVPCIHVAYRLAFHHRSQGIYHQLSLNYGLACDSFCESIRYFSIAIDKERIDVFLEASNKHVDELEEAVRRCSSQKARVSTLKESYVSRGMCPVMPMPF